MNIPLKSPQQIEIMKQGGQLLRDIKTQLVATTQVGTTPKAIDQLADQLVQKAGGQSSFKTVPGYHHTACINIDKGVVHGLPTKKPFKKNHIVTIDLGLLYQGFHTDTATTFSLGKISQKKQNFLEAGQLALDHAINKARPGNHIGHISQAIEHTIKKAGYSPITDLTGHGIGKKLHEAPFIPCFLKEKIPDTPVLQSGMVLAIEVIYAAGKSDLVLESDNWTISTKDGKIAAVFEQTVAVTQDGPLVLT